MTMVGHLQRSVKSVRRKAKCMLKEFDDVTVVLNRTKREGTVVSQDSTFFALLATAPLSCTHCSRCRLHIVEMYLHSLSSLQFSRQSLSSCGSPCSYTVFRTPYLLVSHYHLTVHVGFFLTHGIIHMLVFSNTEIIRYWSKPD